MIDAFVDKLELSGLGFDGVTPEATGRPSYHPAVLLKLYIYGYLNRVRSSRRLEREALRNIEVMWLIGRLTPDHTNEGSDRAQLADIACQAKEVLGVEELEAVADRGYYSGEEILECHKAGIAVTLPKPMTSGIENLLIDRAIEWTHRGFRRRV